jgi:hypothetical protein
MLFWRDNPGGTPLTSEVENMSLPKRRFNYRLVFKFWAHLYHALTAANNQCDEAAFLCTAIKRKPTISNTKK